MKSEKYFYRTIVEIAFAQGHTIQSLAKICNVNAATMARQLKREKGELTSWEAYLLQQAVAPHLSLDELFPEAKSENVFPSSQVF